MTIHCHVTSRSEENDARRPQRCRSDCCATYPRDGGSPAPLEVQQAVHLARELCQRARELQTPQERRQQAELDRMIQSPQRQGDADAAHRPGVPLAAAASGGRPAHPHSRRAGRAAVLQRRRSHAAAGLSVVRRVPAGRGDAVREGADAARDGQRHPAGRARAAWPSICGPAGKKACG